MRLPGRRGSLAWLLRMTLAVGLKVTVCLLVSGSAWAVRILVIALVMVWGLMRLGILLSRLSMMVELALRLCFAVFKELQRL